MRTGEIVGGRYEIGRLAAAGGMGAVFRARDRFSGATVAIKVLLDAPRGQDEVRFEREAQALADLRHPGIVQYVARGVTPSGEPYFVMEWLDGEDLDSRLKRERLTVDESLGIVSRIAEALGAAHSRGIIHRDLKPGNVLLVDRRIDRVKLLDFGIAHLVGVTPMTHTGMLLGTPGYMAPEQARGKEILTARVDVFALGCLLFECLTGVPAFVGDQALALLGKILFDEAPRVRELCPEVPKALDALVARMLDKDPKRRPRDGTAVVELMREIGMSATDTGRPSSVPSPQLSANERRLISVLLIERARSIELDTTWRADAPAAPEEQDELLGVAQSRGGRTAVLADGTVIVTMMGTGVATDQAAHAARCALALRAIAKDRSTALSMGRGDMQGKRPLGDTIDRAAQMLLNRGLPDAIAIDEMTAALLDIRFDVARGEGGFSLRREREHCHQIWRRSWLGKPSPCVGRNRELSILDGLLMECLEEPLARAALLSGPAGMGKSRLACEWLFRVNERAGPVQIWVAGGDSLRSETPFGLLGQVIRVACGIERSEPLELRRSKLALRIARHVPSGKRARMAALFGEITDTPVHDPPEPHANRPDSQRTAEHVREAWEEFVSAECAAQPVLLVLEDLHWSDLPTVRLLDMAMRNLKHCPWMTLALARPDVHELFPRLWIERGLLEIRLGELSRKASERLVRQELGDAVEASTLERIVARADGHAFYLQELIRTAGQREPDELPETVLALAQSRIEGLESEERRILRAASIFGERFWQSGVALLLGAEMPPAQPADWLAGLVDQGILVRVAESRFRGETELAFRPALLRDGAYAMLTDQDRVLGHRLAAAYLERHGETDPAVLAEHLERGKQPVRAGSYFLRAAQQAAQNNHCDTSIRLACRGLSCASPDSVRIGLLSVLTESHSRLREWSAVAPHRDELARLSEPGTGPWMTAMVSKSIEAAEEGRLSELNSHLNALRLVSPEQDGAGMLALASTLSVLGSMGRFDAAKSVLTEHFLASEPANDKAPLAQAWANAVDAYQQTFTHEDPWKGLQNAGAALSIFRDAGDLAGAALSRVSCGMNYWCLGLLERAEHELRDTPTGGEQLGHISSLRSGWLAGVLADRGALEEAHREATRLVETARERKAGSDEGRGRWVLAEILRRAGELDEAEREASMAVSLLRSAPLDELAATATLSAIWLDQRRTSEAATNAAAVMLSYEAFRAFGYRGAYARLVYAKALHAVGAHDSAREAVAIARARLLANAAKIGDADVRTGFLRNVPENARTLELAREWLGPEGRS